MAAIMEQKVELSRLNSDKKPVHFDDLITAVGGFGRYTVCLFVFMCILSIPTGAQNLVQVFYGATPEFHCVQPVVAYRNRSTCEVNKCCNNCSSYVFEDTLTSAVTEVCRNDSRFCSSNTYRHSGIL